MDDRRMVRNKRPLKIILGLNFATVFMTLFVLCFEVLAIIAQCIGCVVHGRWDQWMFCLYFAIGLSCVWLAVFAVALIVCRKRLVIAGETLKVTQGKRVLYACDVTDICFLEHDSLSILRSNIGQLMLVNRKHPLPNDMCLYMSWLSYRRVRKRVEAITAERAEAKMRAAHHLNDVGETDSPHPKA